MRCTRCDRPICPDDMRAASVGFQCPDCVKEGARSVRGPVAAYGGAAVGQPRVTQVLLGLNVLLFVLTTIGGSGFLFGGGNSGLFEQLALAPTVHGAVRDGMVVAADGVAQGQYYRLLTSMFLHFGIIHIALNMYCLYVIGPTLERTLGHLRFAVLYLVSGLGGAAASYALGSPNEQAAGASGAVFGLFAALFVVQRRRGGDVSGIVVTIGLNLALGLTSSSIDVRAHVGGLLTGAAVAGAMVYAPAGRRRTQVQVLGSLLVALAVAAVVAVRTAALTG